MSNIAIVGIIAIATVVCCVIIAKVTGKQKKVTFGGIFAVVSAGGFGYAIAYMVRRGLSGPYLTVAVLVGIIVPVLVFLTVYNLVKDGLSTNEFGTNKKEKNSQPSETDKVYIKKVWKEIELSKQQIEEDQIELAQDKASLEKIAREVQKQKELIEMEKKQLRKKASEVKEPEVKTVNFADLSQETTKIKQGFEEEKQFLLREFEDEKQEMLQEFEEERELQAKQMEEEKIRLRQAFAKEKQLLEEERAKLQDAALGEEVSQDWKKEAEQEVQMLEEEKLYLGQLVKDANVQQRRMEEELRTLRAELEKEKEALQAALSRAEEIENIQRQKEIEAEERRKEAVAIHDRQSKFFDFENVMEKAANLQRRGLYQLAVTLYKEYGEKCEDENQKQQLIKAMADCYIDAGEPAKAKRLLAKR